MRLPALLPALVAVLALSACSLVPVAQQENGPSIDQPRPTQGATPPPAEIVTLTPEEALPEDVYTLSQPLGTFMLGLDLPRGFPVGIPAFSNRWVKATFLSTLQDDGTRTYSAIFAGGYDDVDALLAEFEKQGWSQEGAEELPTRRAYVVQNDEYRVVITASESATAQGEPMDPSYSYSIVVLD